MFQSILFDQEPLTVSALTAHVRALLETDELLADLRVTGEIGNLSRPSSGHLYFTLKDAGAQVRCVMWRSQVVRLRFSPRSGDAVVARGRVGVYERDGTYQLYVDTLTTAGTGDLYAEFERLKHALEAEGLFDQARKRSLPRYPRVLGVVTSPTGAAFQDILNVLKRRCAMVRVILAPTLVQGEEAPEQIVRAIRALDESGECDVILVARGGGSLEELWAFNDERVVRAVVASRVPVVSGVGHETDFTLCDFAADVRAPTPSAAAEIITPDVVELRQDLDALTAQLDAFLQDQVDEARTGLEALTRALRLVSPRTQVVNARQHVTENHARITGALLSRLELEQARVRGLAGRLNAISPLSTLARGYAIVRRAHDGYVVRSVNDVQPTDELFIRVSDGEFPSRVVIGSDERRMTKD
jgi:exodeoxyribonuclease VII large subunit